MRVPRSTSHELHMAPPSFLRRMASCKPPSLPGPHLTEVATPLPMSTHQTAFMAYRSVKQPMFRPPTNPAPYRAIDAPGSFPRSTSTDSYQSYGLSAARKPIRPKKDTPIFTSADAKAIANIRSTSTDAYQSYGGMVRPRKSCRPTTNRAPYSSVDAHTLAIPRSTSKDSFQSFGYRPPPREQFRPPTNPPPYGNDPGY